MKQKIIQKNLQSDTDITTEHQSQVLACLKNIESLMETIVEKIGNMEEIQERTKEIAGYIVEDTQCLRACRSD